MNTKEQITRVKDVVHQDYLIVDGMTSVKDAINQMREKQVEILVIEKRDDDDEYGLVLLVDIAKKILATGRSPERVSLYEIMTKPVLCIQGSMNIKYCARLFNQFGLDKAPAVDHNQQIIGIINHSGLVLHPANTNC